MAPTTPTARICRVCFREFPSGYALGGHMRVHGVLYAEAAMEKERRMLLQQKKHTSKKPPPPPRYRIAATAGATSDQLNWWIDSSAISSVNESDNQFNKIAEPDMELSSSTMDNSMEMSRRKLLYELRRDPKPNYRFKDQEFAFEQGAVVPGELAVSYASYSPNHQNGESRVRSDNLPETAYQWRGSSSAMKGNGSKMKFEEDPMSDVGHGEEEQTQEEQVHREHHAEAEEKKSDGRPKGLLRAKRSLITRKARRIAEDHDSLILHDEDPDSASSEVEEDPDMVACLVLLSMATASSVNNKPGTCPKGKEGVDDSAKEEFAITRTDDPDGKFECSSCKKRFSSHQALGGHRASHKKTKGCFARASLDDYADEDNEHEQVAMNSNTSASRRGWQQLQNLTDDGPESAWDDKESKQAVKVKGSHKCSICHRVFASGQALGGHKRCHWLAEKPPEASTSSNTLPYGGPQVRMLDLNYPASVMGEEGEESEEEEEGMPATAKKRPPPFAPTSLATAAVAENQRLPMSSSLTHLGAKKVDQNSGGSWPFKAASMLPAAVAEQGTTR